MQQGNIVIFIINMWISHNKRNLRYFHQYMLCYIRSMNDFVFRDIFQSFFVCLLAILTNKTKKPRKREKPKKRMFQYISIVFLYNSIKNKLIYISLCYLFIYVCSIIWYPVRWKSPKIKQRTIFVWIKDIFGWKFMLILEFCWRRFRTKKT